MYCMSLGSIYPPLPPITTVYRTYKDIIIGHAPGRVNVPGRTERYIPAGGSNSRTDAPISAEIKIKKLPAQRTKCTFVDGSPKFRSQTGQRHPGAKPSFVGYWALEESSSIIDFVMTRSPGAWSLRGVLPCGSRSRENSIPRECHQRGRGEFPV